MTEISEQQLAALHRAGLTDQEISESKARMDHDADDDFEEYVEVAEDSDDDFEEDKEDEDVEECEVDLYVITNNVNGKKYCGQAVVLDWEGKPHGTEGRWKTHIYEAVSESQHGCHALNRAIRKYGAENFTVRTVDSVSRAEANAKEIDLIALHKSQTPNGYNITAGGGGWRGKHTDAAKRVNSLNKRRAGDEYLPMYVTRINPVPGVSGFCVTPPNKAPYRSFCSMKETMECKLEKAEKYLKDVLAGNKVDKPAHNKDLPKYIHYRPARGGRNEGLRVEVKVARKVIFCKNFHAGTYAEKLQKAKECVTSAKAEGIIAVQDNNEEE